MSRTGNPQLDLMLYSMGVPLWLDKLTSLNRFLQISFYLFCIYVWYTSSFKYAFLYAALYTLGNGLIMFVGMNIVKKNNSGRAYVMTIISASIFVILFNILLITYHLNLWTFNFPSTKDDAAANKLAILLNKTTQYPFCNKQGCIESVTSLNNTVVAKYILNFNYNDLPNSFSGTPKELSDKMRPGVLNDLCNKAQNNFPDPSMKWENRYYSKDNKYLTSVTIAMYECKK